MSKDIAPNLTDHIPAAPKKRKSPTPFDISALVLENTGPPKTRSSVKAAALRAFVQTMQVGQSFLVPKGAANAAKNAITMTFGKGSGAVRIADLEYMRVYRIR